MNYETEPYPLEHCSCFHRSGMSAAVDGRIWGYSQDTPDSGGEHCAGPSVSASASHPQIYYVGGAQFDLDPEIDIYSDQLVSLVSLQHYSFSSSDFLYARALC